MIFIVFHGDINTQPKRVTGISHSLPLMMLMIFSTFFGVWPEGYFSHFFKTDKTLLEIFSGILVVIGVLLAAALYLGKRRFVNRVTSSRIGKFFTPWWLHAWGFDWLYDRLFVKPYLWIAKVLQSDPLNSLMNFPVLLALFANRALSISENGSVRWYAASMGLGAVTVLLVLLFV